MIKKDRRIPGLFDATAAFSLQGGQSVGYKRLAGSTQSGLFRLKYRAQGTADEAAGPAEDQGIS
jgi:hypothetical protein